MSFNTGTAYAESDADDEYERDIHDSSPIDATDAEASPTESDPPSNEHTPTTYGYRSSADRLPETIISEWTADECADFIATIGLEQYSTRFVGRFILTLVSPRGAYGCGAFGKDNVLGLHSNHNLIIVTDLLGFSPRFTENEIVGEALVALLHDDLKSMGIHSVGHRLTILRSVYDVKKAQDVPVESDHYVPLSEFKCPMVSLIRVSLTNRMIPFTS